MFTHPYVDSELARGRQEELLEQARQRRLVRRLHAVSGASRRRRNRALVVVAVAAVGLTLALAGCSTGSSGGTHGSTRQPAQLHSAPGAASAGGGGEESLIGAWQGPVPEPAGDCGTGSGEFVFEPDGTYSFQAIYDSGNCGYPDDGTYQTYQDAQGNYYINFQQQDSSGFWDSYQFENGFLFLCDYPAGACYQYTPDPSYPND